MLNVLILLHHHIGMVHGIAKQTLFGNGMLRKTFCLFLHFDMLKRVVLVRIHYYLPCNKAKQQKPGGH